MSADVLVYSWDFVAEIAGWAKYVAAAVALAGTAFTRDPRFLVSAMLGAIVDIVTLERIAARGKAALRGAESGNVSLNDVAGYMGIRVASKALLLVAALVLPFLLDFWGMVVGVLVVDATIFLVGTWVAATRTFGGGTG